MGKCIAYFMCYCEILHESVTVHVVSYNSALIISLCNTIRKQFGEERFTSEIYYWHVIAWLALLLIALVKLCIFPVAWYTITYT